MRAWACARERYLGWRSAVRTPSASHIFGGNSGSPETIQRSRRLTSKNLLNFKFGNGRSYSDAASLTLRGWHPAALRLRRT